MAEFVKVATIENVPEGEALRVEVNGLAIALFNAGGEIFALNDICSHAFASLSEGYFDGETVACPRHGSLFDIRTGQALTLPAFRPVATYAVRVEDGNIFVEV